MHHGHARKTDKKAVMQKKPVSVIAVTAGKGGVGKSTISLNLAYYLAKKKQEVLLLDADLGLANIDIMLGLHTQYNLSHLIDGECHLNDIVLKGPENFSIIPASSGIASMTALSKAEHAGIINAFSEMMDDLDYMIIDTAAGISDTVLSFACSAQKVLVVVSDEPTSLMDAYALIKIMNQQHGRSHFNILANMIRRAGTGRMVFDQLYQLCDRFIDVSLFYQGEIPFDEKVHDAVIAQKPISQLYPGSKAAIAFDKLSDTVMQWPSSSAITGNTSFFLERLVRAERQA